MPIRVASVDDHSVTSVGIRTLLEDPSESVLVAAHSTVPDLLNDHQIGPIDVVLLDLRLNDGSDPYVNVQSLMEAGLKVVIYSSLESPYLLRRVLRSGVNGVLRKTVSAQVLREAILCAHAGHVYASAE
ncbi:response regulator [Corynebacterium cystitidis]|uniref:response regulator n=1 Tax=Corynebacterium cystitidis TaxID=35757 RepID=UPI00211E6578|nr:response regulator [Corynebacterium cystitidis]